MAFPQIKHCLVCESVRSEVFGKMTLLGFFGVTPDVEIKVKDLKKPLQLAFVLAGGAGDPGGKLEFQLVDQANHVLMSSPPATASAGGKKGVRMTTAVEIGHVYPAPGRYTFRMLVDGKTHYETQFSVLQGTPQDFQA